ncbi:MAG: FecR domain-containing protein [Deltaproteobacteria bacterium]|nr:FecR domain-containing protein [Deltaproteobacteria bacterium]
MGTESLKQLGGAVNDAMARAVPSEEAARAGRAAFLRQVHRPVRRSPAFVLVGAAATVVVLALAWMPLRRARTTVGFVAGEVPGEVGALLETQARPLPLRFDEGSRIELDPRSQLRVAEFGKTKARVQLHRGHAALAIQKGKGRAWAVEAGPFAVNVTGTRFSVDWQPEQQRMEVVLVEGSVTVTGTCLKDARKMVAPQRLVALCDEAPVAFEAAKAAATRTPESEPMPASPKRVAMANNLWWQLAKAGRYQEALAHAKAAGFVGLCRTASAAELLDLGDAARLAGDVTAAEQALGILNKRFPHSPQSALATFHLGRLAFDQNQNYEAAALHFTRYLADNPQGALVGDAWGRLLQARQRMSLTDSGSQAAAHDDARAYLARFPNGPYAGLARRLLSQ